MSTNVYELWLKKREFKSPRLPQSSTARPTTLSTLPRLYESPWNVSKSLQDARGSSQPKCDDIPVVEMTPKSVARPIIPKSRICSQIAVIDEHMEKQNANKDAKRAGVAGSKETEAGGEQVGGKSAVFKRQRSGEERLVASKMPSRSKQSSQLSRRREKASEERMWQKTKPLKSKSRSVQWKQMSDKKTGTDAASDSVTKRLCFDTNKTDRGVDGLDGDHHVKPMGTQVESGGGLTGQFCSYDDSAGKRKRVRESSGLPPKSPTKLKQQKVKDSTLNEFQYWMAVDRFSHLS